MLSIAKVADSRGSAKKPLLTTKTVASCVNSAPKVVIDITRQFSLQPFGPAIGRSAQAAPPSGPAARALGAFASRISYFL